jgi:hypothetical protein
VTFTVGTTEPISDLSEPATVLTEHVVATLDTNGEISVSLICNDDINVDPHDWPWIVDEDVRTSLGVGMGRPRYGIMVSTGDPATSDLDSTPHFPPWSTIPGTPLLRAMQETATLDFPSIGAGSSAELPVTVDGAVVTDHVVVTPQAALPAGLAAGGRVSAPDTVIVRVVNATAGAVDPAPTIFGVLVLRA